MARILVTGGAGFIGSAVVRQLINTTNHEVVNVDALTYAGNLQSLSQVENHPRYRFIHANINDYAAISDILSDVKPTIIMHLAAESHVDRSIDSAREFMHTNIMGTFNLLEAARHLYASLSDTDKSSFRFHHISTDEVYGDLHGVDDLFTETTPYAPSSPYSASKAASDHLVRAWQRTFALPCVITNCSNNYGPYHFPEKLIPHSILNALHGKPLTIYGNGQQIRDWLYVDDHAQALITVATTGSIGETYNIGGHNEHTNLSVVQLICQLLEELAPNKPAGVSNYSDLITFVTDRPGHDLRYAIDASKIAQTLGWTPQETFNSGLRKTVQWYLDNPQWWQSVLDGGYRLHRIGATV